MNVNFISNMFFCSIDDFFLEIVITLLKIRKIFYTFYTLIGNNK